MMDFKQYFQTSLLMVFFVSCGSGDVLEATFTSKAIQREICTEIIDDSVSEEEAPDPECARYEVNHILRYKVIEDSEKRVWLKGWIIAGSAHRNWLGTRDQDNGFLFTRTATIENEDTGCVQTETQTLSLAFPYGVSGFAEVGGVCTPLEGRETIINTTTAGCNENELGSIRTIQKRWEEDPTCEESVEISFSDADD